MELYVLETCLLSALLNWLCGSNMTHRSVLCHITTCCCTHERNGFPFLKWAFTGLFVWQDSCAWLHLTVVACVLAIRISSHLFDYCVCLLFNVTSLNIDRAFVDLLFYLLGLLGTVVLICSHSFVHIRRDSKPNCLLFSILVCTHE